MTAALVAAKEAVAKAEFAAEKRFDAVNEFRATLRDQQSTFISRNEAEIKFKALDDKLSAVIARQNADTGKSEGSAWLWATIVGAIVLFIQIGGFYLAYTRKQA